MTELNPKQQEVVNDVTGPLMVLAGAGSGKTRTIVARISNLIQNKKVSPYKILALTFSNKAAKEMRDRVSLSIKNNTNTLQITTFHSFCARLLRDEAKYLGLSKNFTIYDDGESRIVIKNILARLGASPKDFSAYEILDFINKNKNGSFNEDDELMLTDYQFFLEIYGEYEKDLLKSNAVDFGGLICLTNDLFRNFPEILKKYQVRYEYLLVDEYQDTNQAQFQLVYHLSLLNNNICVVGDEDQSIYSWRGADIRNILDFEKMYANAKIVKLEQNYRSSKNIIAAASRVIENNSDRKGKKLWTDNEAGQDIKVVELLNDKDEAKFVCDNILQLIKSGESLNEIAIFYRTNAQSRLIEDFLRRSNLTYKIIGSVRFYDRKEVKDLVAYLRILINPSDSLALARIINTPTRGIGAVTLKRIEEYAILENMSLYSVLQNIANDENKEIKIRTTKKMLLEIKSFVSLIEESKEMIRSNVDLQKIYENILFNSGYYEWLKSQKTVESKMRLENLDEFASAIKQFCIDHEKTASLEHFLESITLNETQVNEEEFSGYISLMTIHGAKGLEFHHVFLTGLEENVFPSYRSLESDGNIEEERRLYYVAMTRAMKTLTISYAQARLQFGQLQFNPPSRFIDELPKEYCEFIKTNVADDYQEHDDFNQDIEYSNNDSYSSVIRLKSKYAKNNKINHNLYGEGIIIDVSGSYDQEKVMIRFSDGTVKKFMTKFAPLTVLS